MSGKPAIYRIIIFISACVPIFAMYFELVMGLHTNTLLDLFLLPVKQQLLISIVLASSFQCILYVAWGKSTHLSSLSLEGRKLTKLQVDLYHFWGMYGRTKGAITQ